MNYQNFTTINKASDPRLEILTMSREQQLQREIDFREQEEKEMRNKLMNDNKATIVGARIGSSLGFIVALGYAFKVKSGFWKGWGYTILGSVALGGLGAGVGLAIDSSKKK
ncbi:hypothetical protein KY321_01240 [Candidatus Woesearchaeota archaeon]|nr:hypothetical protein [Candidatus Woesearchaeota archaeon]